MPLGELDWEKKLDMFSSTVQEPTEITTDDLRGMLFKEQKFAESVDRFKKAARKVNYTTEMLRVACRLAGILPGENEPLFDRFVKQIDDEAIFPAKRIILRQQSAVSLICVQTSIYWIIQSEKGLFNNRIERFITGENIDGIQVESLPSIEIQNQKAWISL